MQGVIVLITSILSNLKLLAGVLPELYSTQSNYYFLIKVVALANFNIFF